MAQFKTYPTYALVEYLTKKVMAQFETYPA